MARNIFDTFSTLAQEVQESHSDSEESSGSDPEFMPSSESDESSDSDESDELSTQDEDDGPQQQEATYRAQQVIILPRMEGNGAKPLPLQHEYLNETSSRGRFIRPSTPVMSRMQHLCLNYT
jgi:hypothetical protein